MKKGFYYAVGNATEGLPEFYQNSFHTIGYIKREWAWYFEVIAIREQGWRRSGRGIGPKKRK